MAKDKYHNLVKSALISEGWKITDDPLFVETFKRNIQIDLGAQRLIGAQRANKKIAVEVKSFLNVSQVYAFYQALGQILYYHVALEKVEPERTLYLAIPNDTYETFFAEPITLEIVSRFKIKLIVYNIHKNKIESWIK